MTQFNDFLRYKSLALKFSRENSNETALAFMANATGPNGEALTEQQVEEALQLTQVCAKLPRHLSDRIDQVCGVLACTKRQFMEYALNNACDEASQMFEEVGLFEADEA